MASVTDRPTYIYILTDPRIDDPIMRVRYVGKSYKLAHRFHQHCYDKSQTHRACWIRQLKTEGLKPLICTIEEVSDAIWQEREQWWIAYYRSLGANLTNGTMGGDGLHNPPIEVRAKISASVIARQVDPEYRRLLGQTLARVFADPAVKQRRSESSRRANANPELREWHRQYATTRYTDSAERAKTSALTKAAWADPEKRARQVAGIKAAAARRKLEAIPQDPEKKAARAAKVSAQMKARYADPAEREKDRERTTAKWQDPEYRAKMKLVNKEAWVRRKAKQAAVLAHQAAPEPVEDTWSEIGQQLAFSFDG